MVQRQVTLFLAAVAVVGISLFAFFQLKRNVSAKSAAVGRVNVQPPDDDSNGLWRRTESTQTESAAQGSTVSAAGVEKTTEAAAQQIAWSPSTEGFVGSPACAECHQELMDSYKKHPMYWGSTRLVSEDRDPTTSTSSPLQGKKRVLTSETSGSSIVHHELMYDVQGKLIYDDAVEQDYVIGSGRRAKAYMHQQEGVLCLSPLNWFGRENRWGLNPGYTADDPRRFDRRANTICLQCHTGKLNPVEHGSEFLAEKPFEEMEIGCEKCHGPGAEHISFHKLPSYNPASAQSKDPIVNPQDLDRFRRDSVCYQCHLQPSSARILRPSRSNLDFRPGMRLDDVWIVMNSGSTIDAEGRTDSVRQVQQMMESQCYLKSSTMSCTSCHNPHEVPEENQRIEFFRDRCLACHTNSDQCSGPSDQRLAVADSCMECHMPKLDLVLSAHVAQTDHRIIRNRSNSSVGRSSLSDQGEFVFRETNQLPDLEKRRAIAISQVRTGLASTKLVEELQYLRSQFPQDGFLALALGAASVSRKDYQTALESLQQAAAIPQTEELALEMLTQVTYFAQDWPSAFSSMDMYLKLNPYRSQTMAIKADALFRTGQAQRSIDVAKEALKRNPSLIEVHQWLRDTYQKLGKIPEAEAESAILERMKTAKPPI
jgi:predicted CXXCH cytochrome family protein